MMAAFGLYLLVSFLLVVFVITSDTWDELCSLEPAPGRWLVILLILPGALSIVAIASVVEFIGGEDWRDVLVTAAEDIADAWYGR